jgi:hypothetical protein
MPTARKNGCLAKSSNLFYSGGYTTPTTTALAAYTQIDSALEVLTVTATSTASPMGAIADIDTWRGDANAGTDTTNTETTIAWDMCSTRFTANTAFNLFVWGAVTYNNVYSINRCALFTSCTLTTYTDVDPNAYAKPTSAPASAPDPDPTLTPTPEPTSTPTPAPTTAPTASHSPTSTATPATVIPFDTPSTATPTLDEAWAVPALTSKAAVPAPMSKAAVDAGQSTAVYGTSLCSYALGPGASWATGTKMPIGAGTYYLSTGAYSSSIYQLDGLLSGAGQSTQKHNTQANTWASVVTSVSRIPTVRSPLGTVEGGARALTIGDSVYALGGSPSTVRTRVGSRLPLTDTRATKTPVGRTGGKIFAVAGWSSVVAIVAAGFAIIARVALRELTPTVPTTAAQVPFGHASFRRSHRLVFTLLVVLPAHVASYTAITNDNLAAALTTWATSPTTATSTYGPIEDWDTSAVVDLGTRFYLATDTTERGLFNGDISKWNTASVTNMYMVRSWPSRVCGR